MILDFIFLIVGGVLVWLGAEGMVRGSVKLAAYFGISSLVVGLTVVAFGTSAPEFVVSAIASFKGYNEIAFGNVIGSNIINISLVLGISAIIAPVSVTRKIFRIDLPLITIITFAVIAMAIIGGRLSTIDGIILLSVFAGYTIYSYISAKKDQKRITSAPGWQRPELKAKHIVFLVGGMVVLAAGAEGMVRGAVGIAESFGVSRQIIAMTIVAFGTSLPELAASVVAARHGESDLAIGNVVGSNLFNMTLILGTAATIAPINNSMPWYSPNLVFFALTVVLLFPMIRIGWRIGRIDGAGLILVYAIALGFWFI